MESAGSLTDKKKTLVVGTVSTKENWEEMSRSRCDCDLLEWRVDLLIKDNCCDEMANVRETKQPALVTVRGKEEGGACSLSLEERREWYMKLLPFASMIDIEIACLETLSDVVEAARENNVTVIGSAHEFSQPFEESFMLESDHKARILGADMVKFAHMLRAPSDLLRGISWLKTCHEEEKKGALMGMGILGPVSRLLHAQAGSCLVYGYLGNAPTAPGQLPASEFQRVLPFLKNISWQ